MTLLDRIDEAIDSKKGERYIIMRPEAREELKFQIAEREERDIMEVVTEILNTYRGMTIAICEKEVFPDFILCSAT